MLLASSAQPPSPGLALEKAPSQRRRLSSPRRRFPQPRFHSRSGSERAQIVGDQISNSFVKSRRTFEVGKHEGETRNFEPLIHIERIGAINVSECLVGQK